MKNKKEGFLEIIENLKAGHCTPVYLLYGGDTYLEDEAITALSQAFAPDPQRLNRQIFYGEENSGRAFTDALSAVGIFNPHQLLIYKNISKLPSTYRPRLFQYIKNPAPENLLIMTAAAEGKVKIIDTLTNELRDFVVTIPTWTPYPERFSGFVRRHLQRAGYQITDEALQTLIALTDDSLTHACGELDKLFVYLGERRKIEVGDVRQCVYGYKDYDVSDFIAAVSRRNLPQALLIGMALLKADEKLTTLIVRMYNFFMDVWTYSAGGPSRSQSAARQKQIGEGAANYANSNFSLIFQKLRHTDLQIKSVSLPEEDLLVPLLYSLMA